MKNGAARVKDVKLIVPATAGDVWPPLTPVSVFQHRGIEKKKETNITHVDETPAHKKLRS